LRRSGSGSRHRYAGDGVNCTRRAGALSAACGASAHRGVYGHGCACLQQAWVQGCMPYMTPAMLKAAAWAPVFLNREAGDGGALQLSACIPWCIAAQASQRQTEGILCYFAVRKFTGLASPALACKGRAIHSACAGRGAFPPTSVTRDCLLLPTSNDMPVSHLPAQTLVYACRLCS